MSILLLLLKITLYFRSLDDPPGIPEFIGREKRTSPIANLTNVVSEMARAIKSQQSKPASQVQSQAVAALSSSASTGISPGKIANLRSNYLQQMRAFERGALTQPEFLEQKKPILEQLKKLKVAREIEKIPVKLLMNN